MYDVCYTMCKIKYTYYIILYEQFMVIITVSHAAMSLDRIILYCCQYYVRYVHVVAGYNELLIIPAGATTITLREDDGSRSHFG